MTLPEEILAPCICGNPLCTVPFGLCHCTCGEKTRLAPRNDPRDGCIKGEPKKFINGHQNIIRPEIEIAAPFKIDGVYCRLFPTSKGYYGIVDEADYLDVMQRTCYAFPTKYSVYIIRAEKPKPIFLHRYLMNAPAGMEVDHANGVGLDNRRKNMRLATVAQNHQNARRGDKASESGYRGVSADNCGFKAAISVDGVPMYLGHRKTALAAYLELYVPAAIKYHGEFARFD